MAKLDIKDGVDNKKLIKVLLSQAPKELRLKFERLVSNGCILFSILGVGSGDPHVGINVVDHEYASYLQTGKVKDGIWIISGRNQKFFIYRTKMLLRHL